MKLSVNSEETTAFRVSIDMTDKEKADFIQEGIVTYLHRLFHLLS